MSNSITHLYRKLMPRVALLVLLFFGFNLFYKKVFWKTDLEKDADLLPYFLDMKDSVDVLYFGESSNFSNHSEDTLPGRISDFIAAWYPTLRFGTINKGAIHAGIFLPLIKMLDENSRVKTVIVTLNMRTLSQNAIHSKLESALQKATVMYNNNPPLFNRFLMTLSFYDSKTEDERDIAMWREWVTDTLNAPGVVFPAPTIKTWCEMEKFPLPEGGEDMPKRILADHYIKAYAFQINTKKNPRIADLDAIAAYCKSKGIHLVFNLLAENTEYAQRMVGKELVYLMRSNRDILVNRYTKQGVEVVDNLEAVAGILYIDQDWTTEHYKEWGRKTIARNVAKALQAKYPNKYTQIPDFKIKSR